MAKTRERQAGGGDETLVAEPAGDPEGRGSRFDREAIDAAVGRTIESLKTNRAVWVTAGSVALGVVVTLIIGISLANVLVIGLQIGAVYSLVGLGLALVYKATRVLNFAQSILGSVPAFVAYVVMVNFDYGDIRAPLDDGRLWWASLLAVASGVILALLINVVVVQRLAESSPVTSLVATAGVALLFVSAQVIMFQAQLRPFPRYIDGSPFSIGNTAVSWHTVLVVIVLMGAAIALAVFFRTPPGVALLATAQEPFAAELSGVSVRAMSTVAWALAGFLGAIGGLLGAGVFENVRPGFMLSLFLIPAFTGAVLGGLTSMVGAVVGGLLLGVTNAYATQLVREVGFLNDVPGAPQIATLIVLVAVLLFRPRGLLGKEA